MFSRVSVILYTGGMGMPDPRSLLEVCISGGVLWVYQVSVPSRGCSLWVGVYQCRYTPKTPPEGTSVEDAPPEGTAPRR